MGQHCISSPQQWSEQYIDIYIWGHSRQLDDQHRNPNMNNKDHHVGQLTNLDVHLDVHHDVDFDIHLDEVIDVHLGLHFDAHFDAHLEVHFDAYLLL